MSKGKHSEAEIIGALKHRGLENMVRLTLTLILRNT
jgi:hypothetical protein